MRTQAPARILTASLLVTASCMMLAQNKPSNQAVKVTAHIEMPHSSASSNKHTFPFPSAVLWLKPITSGLVIPTASSPRAGYTLLQKDKIFYPHLLVVPTGSVVQFPNADPFFHNVFSLFNGQRFDLGLYEAGKTKAVTFSREGVSYIFCNIHPDMGAVVVSLSTPFYSTADAQGTFHIDGLPVGEYEMHVWVEGEQQSALDHWARRVTILNGNQDIGTILVHLPVATQHHANKFGQPYDHAAKPVY
jgi:plastocyanin